MCLLPFFVCTNFNIHHLKTRTIMGKFQKTNLPENITEEERRAAMFDALYSLDLSDKLERREENDKLSYLSWANAWAEFKRAYPDASYRIVKDTETNLPYFNDPDIGIMVYTEVTADNQTYEMWLPVMNGANKAMKTQPYTYQVYDGYKRQYVEKTVQAATMFDVNKAIMRCLVKNLAMFGLGLYVYAGEDLPEKSNEEQQAGQGEAQTKRQTRKTGKAMAQPPVQEKYAGIKAALSYCNDPASLMNLYRQHRNEVENNAEIKALFTERKQQIQTAA